MDIMVPEFKWSEELTKKFIALRVAKNDKFRLGKRTSSKKAYIEIVEQLGLQDEITSEQARKKWNNLVQKYKDFKQADESGVLDVSAISWPYYQMMDTAICQGVVMTPEAYLGATVEGEFSGASTMNYPMGAPRKRKRLASEDAILALIRNQSEALEKQEAQFAEFSSSVVSLLERLVTVMEKRSNS